MSVVKPPWQRSARATEPAGGGPAVHPLLALALSLSTAALTGLLVDWPAAVTVLVAVLGMFAAADRGQGE